MKLKHKADYREKRRDAYLPLEEQLDLLYHDPEAWKAHIEEVKTRFPKPNAE